MKNVLWLMDRFCDSNPNYGITSNFHNFYDTFLQCQSDYKSHTLFYDESAIIYGRHIDQVLYNYCKAFNINLCFVFFQGESQLNPSITELKNIKNLGVKVVIFWPDNNPLDMKRQDVLHGIADLHIALDNPRLKNGNRQRTDNRFYLWTAENKNLFYPDKQDIDISFIGSSRYKERADYLTKLKEMGLDILIDGGQRESRISAEKYASLIRRSKIGVNFCVNPMGDYHQTKGRVFEIISSKSLLLEEKNLSTRDFFTPDEDYIEFNNSDELIDKINFYKQNPEIASRIAQNGYNKFQNNFTAKHFWDKVMGKL